jgi:DNA-binding NtrC family response regulator
VTLDSLNSLLVASPDFGTALPGLERAAASEAPILIVGEAGSGRSLLAQLMHRASGRSEGPLVEADLATIPAELFESELFGHLSGAFTGAGSDNPGRVGRAQGGSLILDHIEEVPLALQPKLLRLVAEKFFSPLGGGERRADVRIISIGSPDLADRIARGAFREDLFYRLEVLSFRVPPLRERRSELPELAMSLLEDLCARTGRPVPRLSAKALEWMTAYHWPGNLRQLRGVLERELVLPSGEELNPEPPGGGERTPVSLEVVEREHITRVLRYTRGHQGRAAELLGISRKTLWEKRRRYDLP